MNDINCKEEMIVRHYIRRVAVIVALGIIAILSAFEVSGLALIMSYYILALSWFTAVFLYLHKGQVEIVD